VPRIVPVGRRGSWRLAAAAALVLVAAACGDDGNGNPPQAVAPTTAAPSASAPAPAAAPAEQDAATPVQIEIPSIGVDAPVVPLGLEPSGVLEAPEGLAETGWWADGPEPGEAGPAVVAGHVDSRAGPAVFYRLGELRPGDPVDVLRADGSRVVFTVERLEQHPKADFPTEAVYGDTAGPALRLVTCGGAFDRSTGHYVDNVIVYATAR
jgi:sortase (surface protein transpeptidase)